MQKKSIREPSPGLPMKKASTACSFIGTPLPGHPRVKAIPNFFYKYNYNRRLNFKTTLLIVLYYSVDQFFSKK